MKQYQIPTLELEIRRAKIIEQMVENSTFVLFGAKNIVRNSDVEYPFRQTSNFWYLTGINQPDSVLIIKKTDVVETNLYVLDKDKTKEIWHGKRLTKQEGMQNSGIENVFWLSELNWQKLEQTTTVYLEKPNDYFANSLVLDPNSIITSLREKKSKWEIEQMQIASKINCEAHIFAVKNHKVGNWEYQFEADLLHFWKKNNLNWSYPPIVASGSNATILHYITNDKQCKDGDLLLVDAGCEVNYYASDITRCYPNNGKFSPAQAEIYQLVLDCNKKLINYLKAGISFVDYHKKSVEILTKGLIDLKILKTDLKTAIQNQEYTKFYMHGIGHWLGLDVHDLGTRFRDTVFEEGHCVTVEPGLYFDPNDESIPAKYRGIGIRIEDDIVITKTGVLNLTQHLPKEISEIENLMKL